MQDTSVSNIPEFSVGEFSKKLQKTLEDNFSYVKIKGEISGFKRHSSGHCYFSLKDNEAVLNAIMWKGYASKVDFPLQDGLEVTTIGKITTFAGRSQYQIIVEEIKPAGIGALMALLEQLKKKLADEGLFHPSRKKLIPFLPKIIAVITSPTGAVIRDILHRLKDRTFPHIYVFPVAVQGELSARQITYAINYLNKCTNETMVKRPDVIIVARGGGSVEDLWSFNEEIVVRAVANSEIPIISAVGHETDITLCDFAADKRAPTPTAATEMAVPVKEELILQISQIALRLKRGFLKSYDYKKEKFQQLEKNFPDIKKLFLERQQNLDLLEERLGYNLKNLILIHKNNFQERTSLFRPRLFINYCQNHRKQFTHLEQKLKTCLMNIMRIHKNDIIRHQNMLNVMKTRLEKSFQNHINRSKEKLTYLSKTIESLSYKNTLSRGFAVIHSGKDFIESSEQASQKKITHIEFRDGIFEIK